MLTLVSFSLASWAQARSAASVAGFSSARSGPNVRRTPFVICVAAPGASSATGMVGAGGGFARGTGTGGGIAAMAGGVGGIGGFSGLAGLVAACGGAVAGFCGALRDAGRA